MNNAAVEMARWIKPDFMQQLTAMKQDIDEHPVIQQLRGQYPNFEIDYSYLYQIKRSSDGCKACPGLQACPNTLPGHYLSAVPDPTGDKKLNLMNTPCGLQQAADKQSRINRMVKSHYVPNKILQTTFEDLEHDPDRKLAIKEAMKFCVNYKPGKTIHGLYFYGGFGVGKSSIFGAIARELAGRGVDVLLVYVPDFMDEIKGAISTNEVEIKLDALRRVSVLMLDDIGAETLTEWTRDSVLGPVLQSRMETLPTLYTSNLTLAELKTHLIKAKAKNENPDPMKGKRLFERIEPFVNPVFVGGRNRRRS